MNLSIFTVFLKNRNFTSKIKRAKVTDYAALTCRWRSIFHISGPLYRCNWLAAHRADLPLVRLPFVYICSKVLWQDVLPFTNSDTVGSPRPPPVPFWLGLCAPPAASWIISALPLDHCYSTSKSACWLPLCSLRHPGCDRLFSDTAATF